MPSVANDTPAEKPEKRILANSPEELGKNLFEALKNKKHKYQLVCSFDLVEDQLAKQKASEDLKKRTETMINMWQIGFALWLYEERAVAEKTGVDWAKAELIEVTHEEAVLVNEQKTLQSIQLRIRTNGKTSEELIVKSPAAAEFGKSWVFTPQSKSPQNNAKE